jgi:drug/metabolite transporter (DMT)-like permease
MGHERVVPTNLDLYLKWLICLYYYIAAYMYGCLYVNIRRYDVSFLGNFYTI